MDESKEKYLVYTDARLKEALVLIEENNHHTLIVLSRSGVVVGTLSDGDVRRKLLEGRLLEIPVSEVMNTNFIALSPNDRERARELFKKAGIFLIPVVDEQSRLVDVIEAY